MLYWASGEAWAERQPLTRLPQASSGPAQPGFPAEQPGLVNYHLVPDLLGPRTARAATSSGRAGAGIVAGRIARRRFTCWWWTSMGPAGQAGGEE